MLRNRPEAATMGLQPQEHNEREPSMPRSTFIGQLTANHTWMMFASATLVTTVLLAPSQTRAGDYYHVCRSVDGRYVMHDESLQTAEDERAGSARSINSRVRNKIVLKKEEGYCFARPQGGGRRTRFNFAYSRYVLDIAFRDDGQNIKTSLLCELAADGLPAAYRCQRRIVTVNWSLQPQQPPSGGGARSDSSVNAKPSGGSLWLHNGSVMRLTANGNARQIRYERPRPNLARRGVKQGELLFEGRRNANTYSGTAYIFTKSCGKAAYVVSGLVEDGGTRVVMTGLAPRLNSSCRQIGTREDRLVFTLRQ